MARSWIAVLLAACAVTGASGCKQQQAATPAGPTGPSTTDNFSGTLTLANNGLMAHHFTIGFAGTSDLDVKLTAIAPNSSLTLAVGVGTWDNSASTCTVQSPYPAVALNTTLPLSVPAANEYCVQISVSANVIIALGPVDYTVQAIHF